MKTAPPLHALAWLFFRIGTLTFGSGNTTSIRIGQAMAERGWAGQALFDLNFTLARMVPGTNVLAFVFGMGYAVRGVVGGMVALLSLSAPASIIVVLLTYGYQRWNEIPVGHAFVTAAMAAISGIVVGACWLLVRPKLGSGDALRTLSLALGGLLLSQWLPPLPVLGLAAAAGYVWQERKE